MPKSGDKPGGLARPFRVTDGRRFRLSSIDPGDTRRFDSKKRAPRPRFERDIETLTELQEKLYAQNRWALLLIFQAMDGAGKDSTIKHVMSGVNPQGCQVFSFKAPSDEELDHDFMWRTTCRASRAGPDRHLQPLLLRGGAGRPGPPRAARPPAPAGEARDAATSGRSASRTSTRSSAISTGTASSSGSSSCTSPAEEQRQRFLDRLDEPEKNWKFSLADVRERRHWDEYMAAYEDVIRRTSSPHAPWYVVPADHKWFTRLVVVSAILDTLSSLDLAFPRVEPDRMKELEAARVALANEAAGAPLSPPAGGGARRRRSGRGSRARRARPASRRG